MILPDPNLIPKVIAGDESAALELHKLVLPIVYNYLQRNLGKSEAEDLTPEVVERVFLKIEQPKAGSFFAWVRAVTRTQASDYLRRAIPARADSFDDPNFKPERQLVLTRDFGDQDAAAALTDALAKLDRNDVLLLQARHEDTPVAYHTLAQELADSEENLRTRCKRAKKKLHALLLADPRMHHWRGRKTIAHTEEIPPTPHPLTSAFQEPEPPAYPVAI